MTTMSAAPAARTRSGSAARRIDSSAASGTSTRWRKPREFGQGRAGLLRVLQAVPAELAEHALRLIDVPRAIGVHADLPVRAERVADRRDASDVLFGAWPRSATFTFAVAASGGGGHGVGALGPDGGNDRVHRYPITHRRRPPGSRRLDRAGQPAGALLRAVLGEGRELGPASRPADQSALADGDAAEGGAHRDREGAQPRDQAPGPGWPSSGRCDGSPEGVGTAGTGDQGRRGNLAKSGVRFSLKASLPSCASSLM